MDDASSEDMSDIEKICSQNNFQYIGKEKNVGLMRNFNNVLMRATGSHIALVHNDDLLSRRYIEEVKKFIRKYPGYKAYVTNGIGIDEKKVVVAEFRLFRRDTIIRKKSGIKKLWAKNNLGLLTVIGSSVYDAEFLQKNPLDPTLGNEADAEKALFLLKEADIMYVDKPIYFTTLHKDQASYKNKLSDERLQAYIKNRLAIFKKFQKDFEHVPFYLAKIKTLHMLQLSLKYGYGPKRLWDILEIRSLGEWGVLLFLGPVLAYHAALKRIAFFFNKGEIDRYLQASSVMKQ